MMKVISAAKADGQSQIRKVNSEIISLSLKEKNFILGTFVIQFFDIFNNPDFLKLILLILIY